MVIFSSSFLITNRRENLVKHLDRYLFVIHLFKISLVERLQIIEVINVYLWLFFAISIKKNYRVTHNQFLKGQNDDLVQWIIHRIRIEISGSEKKRVFIVSYCMLHHQKSSKVTIRSFLLSVIFEHNATQMSS
jgi:hypothetical protein